MDFEQWWDKFALTEINGNLGYNARKIWQAAQAAERDRAKELVEAAEYAAEILDQYVQRHAHAKYVRAAITKYKEGIAMTPEDIRELEAERERILKIVEQVGIQGNHDVWFDCCDTIVERIKNELDT